MSESDSPSVPVETPAGDDPSARKDRRTALFGTQLGAAFGLGAVVLGALTALWLSSFGYRMPVVTAATGVGLAACIVELALVVLQFLIWRRALAQPVVRELPGAHASRLLHWVSYPVTLIAIGGYVWAMGWIALDQLGFWTLFAGALLVLLAHSLGGVQMLRHDGPPGTIRAHLQGLVARSNARADAELDPAEQAATDPDQRAR